ncbi:uncharacterized protein KY384_006174 [Bacidia gigantensis]|uniref:uncharacterized protein n=1 Tax=Bacidia gigantensis TaxID=2732470 RepID=UPI001D04606D|nr:uncharacterized protein KY384_006174 [Bacidia gigantensis]KAG8529537.1 hypothetical protein KY384_006174 [Bacidia gigantensis]
MTQAIDTLTEKLEELLMARYPKTICPSEVPRSFEADELNAMGVLSWRELMPTIREIVWDKREKKEVEVLQKGQIIEGYVQLRDVTDDFLSEPAQCIQKKIINFKEEADLPEYDGLYACVLDDVFTAEECTQLTRAAESTTDGVWEQGTINVGGGRQQKVTDVRNCGRILWDDRNLVAKIWSRCQDHLPELKELKDQPRIAAGPARRKETWEMTRLNERMRFLSYVEGNYFRPHMDGSFATEGNEEISYYTLHLYLNEPSQDSQLEGGATTFHSMNMRKDFNVMPKAGRVLIFQQRSLIHSGADVISGVKFTMRTDLMYKKKAE